MDDNLKNRAPKNKGGRPTLIEQAARERTPAPTPVQQEVQRLQCSRCGRAFLPRVYRTVGTTRFMRCDRCGYSHPIPPELLAKLIQP